MDFFFTKNTEKEDTITIMFVPTYIQILFYFYNNKNKLCQVFFYCRNYGIAFVRESKAPIINFLLRFNFFPFDASEKWQRQAQEIEDEEEEEKSGVNITRLSITFAEYVFE
jgi:hypothetical protein